MKHWLLISIVWCGFVARGQALKELVVGDTLPDHVIANSIGLKEKNLLDFKGKLTILDFWSTGCAGCVESFPKLESLQKKFGPELQIVLVNTSNTREEIDHLLKRRERAGFEPITLPHIYGDRVLSKTFFAVKSVPHIVWVDRAGKIFSITSSLSLNEANIRQFLNGTVPEMTQLFSRQKHTRIASELPLYVDGNGGEEVGMRWRSYLGSYDLQIDVIQSMFAADGGFNKITNANVSIMDLYRYAYSDRFDQDSALMPLPASEVVLEVPDRVAYTGRSEDNVHQEHLYVYELNVPPMSRQRIRTLMREDLDRYFGLNVTWQSVQRPFLVLSTLDSGKYAYRKGPSKRTVTPSRIDVNNMTMEDFVAQLKESMGVVQQRYPLRDETNYKGRIGKIRITGDVEDSTMVAKKLRKRGLKLAVEERAVRVLVLGEPGVRQGIFPLNSGRPKHSDAGR